MSASRPSIVALIATKNRPQLLAARALASVAAQTRKPDLLIVADDSDSRHHKRNAMTAAKFAARHKIRARYIINHRARGASGCWNSGVLAAAGAAGSLDETYMVILDDDDEWLGGHLANIRRALRGAGGRAIDFMAASYERCEPHRRITMPAPQKLNGRDFLAGSPGAIGSTMVVRLSALMRAGLFDESLPSCTDRDLCFRLSLLPGLRYRPLSLVSVVHHADTNRPRLSTRGGAAKLKGLARFADKYRSWMSGAEWRACVARKKSYFGWRASDAIRHAPAGTGNAQKSARAAPAGKHAPIALVAGIILDPARAEHPLVDDLAKLAGDRRLSSLDLVVMPSASTHVNAMRAHVKRWRRAGLRVYFIDNACTRRLAHELGMPAAARKHRPVGVNRALLQHVAAGVGHGYLRPVYWILDGDVRLHCLSMSRGRLRRHIPDYVGEMLRLRARGCDAAIGRIDGAAPLPRALSVRAQMIDLLHFCARLKQPPSKRQFPAQTIAHTARFNISPDYYHDCGDHPHLEQPVGLPPLPANCSYPRFLRELPRLLARLLAGDAVTRPLFGEAQTSDGGHRHRGGNTLVFGAEALKKCPNGLVRGAFADMRRQDEMWCILGRAVFGMRIAGGGFPVTQSRAFDAPQAPDMVRVHADITGHAVASALRETLGARKFDSVDKLAKFILRDAGFAVRARDRARARAAMVRVSFMRIAGVAGGMRRMLEDDARASRWRAETQTACAALRAMERKFARAQVADVLASAASGKSLRAAVADLPGFCRQLTELAAHDRWWLRDLRRWRQNQRRQNAAELLAKTVKPKAPLRFLGCGNEGTVFTDGRHVYKVLHRWFAVAEQPEFLCAALSSRKCWTPHADVLYPIARRWRDRGDLVLAMPYEKTARFDGGCAPGMVEMLSELRRRGIALRNIAPWNLRRCRGRVRLIDYGKQIQPFTKRGFDFAARKAWICCHYAARGDLRALLTATLAKDAPRVMPELRGYRRMKRAAEEYATRSCVADTAHTEILSVSPKRVLDYGCGKGRMAVALARAGVGVVAYDPYLTLQAGRALRAAEVPAFSDRARLAGCAPFDAVLIHHVLCEIRADRELIQCLRTVRGLTAPHGRVVVTTCDMEQPAAEKLHALNLLPHGANGKSKFFYHKRIRASGAVRAHVHRPCGMLEKIFVHAGFSVMSRRAFADMDLTRLAPCGGVLQWVLTPVSAGIARCGSRR